MNPFYIWASCDVHFLYMCLLCFENDLLSNLHSGHFWFQPPMEDGGRRRHSSSGDGRRRHPSQPSSRPHSQASSGPSPAPNTQGPAAKDDAKPTSHRAPAPAADLAPDAKTLK